MGRTKNILMDPSVILDFNQEGYENVPSEDFDPGFGCVPLEVERKLAPPPPVTNHQDNVHFENLTYLKQTDAEKQIKEDEFLKQFGI